MYRNFKYDASFFENKFNLNLLKNIFNHPNSLVVKSLGEN